MTLPSRNALRPLSRGICIIMAGGRGTRFWPLSRADRPKQLLALSSGRSLLRETFDRIEPLVGADRILVITSGSLAEPTRAELPELSPEQVINEPVGRNTAPCAVLGMGVAGRIDPAAPVALLPADHYIPDLEKFRSQLQMAFDHVAKHETVLTLGIPPTRPETGYGYILAAEDFPDSGVGTGLGFVEKPDFSTAEQYVRGGKHFWNSGIFVWNPRFFEKACDSDIPEIRRFVEPAVDRHGTKSFAEALDVAYRDCPAVSLDVAVMEKLTGFALLAADFRWSDLGSWDAWGELAEPLPEENLGRADLLPVDSRGNILMIPEKLVALVGVENMIIVDSADALLVCRKDQAQRLKEVIVALEKTGRDDLL
ncbi:MAG: NTP transferase domain-containing protein [Gemmatimonadales bacterium]|nr:NTP transferase domain-containing protein [Gemmatimonadales bacterium]